MGFLSGSGGSISELVVDANLAMGLSYETLNRIVAASASVLDSEDAAVQVTANYATWTKKFQAQIPTYMESGIIRLSASIKPDFTPQTAYVKWEINDVITPGGEQTFDYVDGSTYGVKEEDVVIHPGDIITWWMKCSANYYTYKDIRVKGTESPETARAWDLASV